MILENVIELSQTFTSSIFKKNNPYYKLKSKSFPTNVRSWLSLYTSQTVYHICETKIVPLFSDDCKLAK